MTKHNDIHIRISNIYSSAPLKTQLAGRAPPKSLQGCAAHAGRDKLVIWPFVGKTGLREGSIGLASEPRRRVIGAFPPVVVRMVIAGVT